MMAIISQINTIPQTPRPDYNMLCAYCLLILRFLQNYPLLLSMVKAGDHRGLTECQRQFKNEIWNCSLDTKIVYQQLSIFVQTLLPHGKSVLNAWLGILC